MIFNFCEVLVTANGGLAFKEKFKARFRRRLGGRASKRKGVQKFRTEFQCDEQLRVYRSSNLLVERLAHSSDVSMLPTLAFAHVARGQ
jgi:hypothetical protein